MADAHQTTPSNAKRFRRLLRENKAFIELCGLLAALAVLGTYFWNNHLIQKSIDLNRKQMMSAYVPWISLAAFAFDSGKNRITYKVKNNSPAPAFLDSIDFEVLSRDKSVIVNDMSTKKTLQGIFVAPNSANEMIKAQKPIESPVSDIERVFWEDKISIKITVDYHDAVGRNYSLTEIADPRPEGEKEIILSQATISGLDQLK
jgi:hypothetical protein